jgi:hypothetical protein
MVYIHIGICIVLIIAIYIFIVFKKNRLSIENFNIEKRKDTRHLRKKLSNDLVIKIETLPIEAIKDENDLIEITDNKVLA